MKLQNGSIFDPCKAVSLGRGSKPRRGIQPALPTIGNTIRHRYQSSEICPYQPSRASLYHNIRRIRCSDLSSLFLHSRQEEDRNQNSSPLKRHNAAPQLPLRPRYLPRTAPIHFLGRQSKETERCDPPLFGQEPYSPRQCQNLSPSRVRHPTA